VSKLTENTNFCRSDPADGSYDRNYRNFHWPVVGPIKVKVRAPRAPIRSYLRRPPLHRGVLPTHAPSPSASCPLTCPGPPSRPGLWHAPRRPPLERSSSPTGPPDPLYVDARLLQLTSSLHAGPGLLVPDIGAPPPCPRPQRRRLRS
jgi:hypothetical protein